MVTTYFKNLLMNEAFNTIASVSSSLPTKYYLAWSTVVPTSDGVGFTEPNVTTGYSRIEITGILNSVNGVVTNGKNLYFPESTDNQGIAKAYGLYDTTTNGNLLMFNAFTATKNVALGITLFVKSNELKLTLSGV